MSIDTYEAYKTPYYSLKGRLLLGLSVVLLVINAGFALLVYQKASNQYVSEQKQRRATQLRELGVLLDQGVESMAAFASFIPRLSALVSDRDEEGPFANLESVLEQHGLLLGVEWGLQGIHYFDARSLEAPQISWPDGRSVPPAHALIEEARKFEAPTGGIHCADGCAQLVVLPVLVNGSTEGFFVLERSLGDILRAFYLTSGADLAVLYPGFVPEAVQLRSWSFSVPAVTRPTAMLPIIRRFVNSTSLAKLKDDPMKVEYEDEWYEVAIVPQSGSLQGPLFLGITRVTMQVKAIHEALAESIILGVVGLVFSVAALSLLLLGPVHRIQEVVDLLPLFKEKAFRSLREALPALPDGRVGRDETAVLVDVVSEVSRQMEDLENAHSDAQEALRESERSMRLAQSMARVAVWSGIPLDGTLSITEGAERIHPLMLTVGSWKELIGMVHPEDRAAVQLAWRQGRGGSYMDVEFRLVVEGRQIHIHAMAEFEIVGRERTLRAAGMMQDVSEMRRAEREVSAHRERLEEEVFARTAELAEARNKAEKLARAKGDFLATMSHEIRTPLNAVIGLSQIGIQQSQGREIGKTFDQIMDAGDHLLNVVNDVLDHSKLEAGKIEIESRPFELSRVIDQSVGMLGPRVEGKGLQMPVKLSSDVPAWLEGDAFRLQQILINLLSNAVKFTEHGTVSLDVFVADGQVHFNVTDTGVGMTRNQMAQLFTPFHQLATSDEHRLEGTGLGLSISNTLAILMGGEISVRSQLGRGSEFELVLPCVPATGEQTPEEDGQQTGLRGIARLREMRILVVDDVSINRTVLESLLEVEGARVRCAVDGQAAVVLLKSEPAEFDAILMDVHMPNLDGRAATRRIRQMGLRLPVIGVTADSSHEERIRSMEAGMDDQLVKPVLRESLVEILLRHTAAESSVNASRSFALVGAEESLGTARDPASSIL